MKLEVPVNVDIDDVTKLIHDLQCLQTYKLGVNDTMVLVSLDDVADVFADHIRAKRLDKDINVPSKWIPVSERLPETSEDILILLGDYKNMSVGRYYAADGEWYADFGEGPFDGVVAWMPLPEPLKKVSLEPWEGE